MGVHKFTACRYCADQIDVQYLVRHEANCKTATPEEREESKRTRSAAREAYRKSVRLPVGNPKPRTIRRNRQLPSHHSQSVWANGNGRRLSATISIDFKSFRELLLQLAPQISIDKVEVL